MSAVKWDDCRTHWSLTHFPALWTALIHCARCLRGWRSAKWMYWSPYLPLHSSSLGLRFWCNREKDTDKGLFCSLHKSQQKNTHTKSLYGYRNALVTSPNNSVSQVTWRILILLNSKSNLLLYVMLDSRYSAQLRQHPSHFQYDNKLAEPPSGQSNRARE